MKKNIASLKGQISIWDIEVKEKPKKIDIISEENISKVDKTEKQLKLTVEQQDFINENKIIENENLSRIIKYCSGGLGIELQLEDDFRTIYINKEGKKEFEFSKKSTVLPMDEILYYKDLLETNDIQEEKLKDLHEKLNVQKVIKRKGDENIIIDFKDKVISIIPKGWVLEFSKCKVKYTADEVIDVNDKKKVGIETIQDRVKVGDTVEAIVGKDNRLVKGKITRMYGMGNAILNIVFDKNTKHTAIGRYAIRKIICA